MEEAQAGELLPDIRALTEDFAFIEGQIGLAPDQLRDWLARLKAVANRPQLLVQLVIVARRFAEQNARAAQLAIAQLAALTALLLGDEEQAADLFSGSGVDAGAAAKALGQEGQSYKLEDNPQKAAASLLGVLKSKK
jgi:hypothetical protein